MKREDAKKHLDLITKFAAGVDIQVKNLHGNWIECPEPMWYENYEYRVKPPTRKIGYGVLLMSGAGTVHPVLPNSKTHYDNLIRAKNCVRILHEWKEWEEEVSETHS